LTLVCDDIAFVFVCDGRGMAMVKLI
jgi:hypothetical protein